MPLGAAEEVPVALAFGAGLVASINPCGFALLPSLFFYYLGTRASGKSATERVADGLVVGLVLSAGFMIVFGAMGMVLVLGAQVVVRVVPWVTVVIGLGLIVLGGWLVAGKHLRIRTPGFRLSQGSSYPSMFVFGMVHAVGSLSCTLPVFLLVVSSGLAAGSVGGTVSVFLAYGFGMSTVLMLLCLGTAGFRELLVGRIRPLLPHVNRISGVLLLLGGAYVVYYWTSLLRGADQRGAIRFVQDLQRWVQDLVLGVEDRVWFLAAVALAAAALLTLAIRLWRREDLSEDEAAGYPDGDLPASQGKRS